VSSRPDLLVLAALALATGCAHGGGYFWVEALPPAREAAVLRIAPGDLLSVRVWNHDNLAVRERVRDDGRISLPFLNDVQADGQTTEELALRVRVKLSEFLVDPVVTVSLEERRPLKVSVVGEVARPGVYEFERGVGVLQALAAAGGLSPYAGRSDIYVIRPGHWADRPAEQARIRFRWAALAHAEGRAGEFRLRPGDTVVVE
jgi:polysaccharide biosynthesis/export protein